MDQNGRMLKIGCETARYRGRGRFRCRVCRSVTTLVDLSAVLLILPHASVLYDAQSGTILHDCRHIHTLDPGPLYPYP
jgi:hypothetical protein